MPLTPTQSRKIFEKELLGRPATADELWIAIQLLADDYVPRCKNHMDPVLDYLDTARQVLDSLSDPKSVPLEEIKRQFRELSDG